MCRQKFLLLFLLFNHSFIQRSSLFDDQLANQLTLFHQISQLYSLVKSRPVNLLIIQLYSPVKSRPVSLLINHHHNHVRSHPDSPSVVQHYNLLGNLQSSHLNRLRGSPLSSQLETGRLYNLLHSQSGLLNI
jgi:hypothetical protein